MQPVSISCTKPLLRRYNFKHLVLYYSINYKEKGGKNLAFRTQKLFLLLNKGERPSVKPNFFKIALPDDFAYSYAQHDASEFAKAFLDALENKLKTTDEKVH